MENFLSQGPPSPCMGIPDFTVFLVTYWIVSLWLTSQQDNRTIPTESSNLVDSPLCHRLTCVVALYFFVHRHQSNVHNIIHSIRTYERSCSFPFLPNLNRQ